MKIKYFTLTLLCILIYTFSFQFLAFDGFSLAKVIYTTIGWVLIFVSGKYFVERFSIVKTKYGKWAAYLLVNLLGWNLILVFRSIYQNPNDILTILGNEETALALLAPLVIGFSVDKANLKIFYQWIFKYLILLVLFTFPFFFINNSQAYLDSSISLFIPLYFLITISFIFNRKNKLIVYICTFLLAILAVAYDSRTTLLYIIILCLILGGSKLFGIYRNRITNKAYLLILIIPLLAIYFSLNTGESIIQSIFSYYSTEEVGTDTRTFLYIELYQDLNSEEGALLFGRGANGTYYSPYFSQITGGDASNRLTVEIGWLWLLLRGGFVSVILYSTFFITAIYNAFQDSRNKYIKALAWIIVVYYFMSFISNTIYLDIYHYLLWFTMGILLNKEIRYMNDREIKKILFS